MIFPLVYELLAIRSVIITTCNMKRHTGVCEKENTPPEKKTLESISLKKHQIRGWRAASAAGPQGNSLQERSACSETPVTLGLEPLTIICCESNI